jgi:hypothetical protein
MKPGTALGLALRDFYENSWRLVAVNALLGVVLVVGVFAALARPFAAVLLVAGGPLVAALVHCAVTLVRSGNLELADAWEGFRRHWRRGLELGVSGIAVVGLGVLAYRFYAGASLWPLAFLTLYVLVLLGIYGLVVWTLAITEPNRRLRSALREAGLVVAARPGATLVLGMALLLVNLAGIAAAVMPFLTLTIAYTFLATAHFVLPQPTPEEIA